ncbi:hypothetical protein GOP47_0014096, partial [Adiantum capillus-veneris]
RQVQGMRERAPFGGYAGAVEVEFDGEMSRMGLLEGVSNFRGQGKKVGVGDAMQGAARTAGQCHGRCRGGKGLQTAGRRDAKRATSSWSRRCLRRAAKGGGGCIRQ